MTQIVTLNTEAVHSSETSQQTFTTRRETPPNSRQNVLSASHIVFPPLHVPQFTHLLCARHETQHCTPLCGSE